MERNTPDSQRTADSWSTRLRSRASVIAILVVIGSISGYYVAKVTTRLSTPPSPIPGVLWPDGVSLTEFSLTDHDGRPFTLERLKGRWTLLSFGYLSCPDVCPTTVKTLDQALQILANEGHDLSKLQTVFVSVDPERDTNERLRDWLGFFNPDFIGVSADHVNLQAFAHQVAATYRVMPPDDNGFYMVEHTASVLLIDPQPRLVAILGAPVQAGPVAARVGQILTEADGR